MHDPISLLAMRGSPSVEDKGLSHPNLLASVPYALVSSSCLPKPYICCPVSPRACGVLPVFVAEEIPFILRCRSYLTPLCQQEEERAVSTICLYLKKRDNDMLVTPNNVYRIKMTRVKNVRRVV